MTRTIVAAIALAMSGVASAQTPADPDKPWSAEVGLGIMMTFANTHTSSVNGTGDVVYQVSQWRHSARAEALRSSTDGDRTAERYQITGKSDYRLDDRNYLFGLLGYEDDRFSGYDYQANASVGYGRDLVRGPTLNVNAELGVGARHNRLADTDESDTEGTVRVAGALSWNISDAATFSQQLDSTIGEDLPVTNSISSLSTQVVGNLAAKLSVHVRHISDVPDGVEKRDTKTTANLVYKF